MKPTNPMNPDFVCPLDWGLCSGRIRSRRYKNQFGFSEGYGGMAHGQMNSNEMQTEISL